MKARTFDELAVALGRSTSRRRVAAGALAAVLGAVFGRGGVPEAAAFDEDCRRFQLSAGEDPDKKLRHVDDDVKFEVRHKGDNRWETIYEDDSGDPNDNGKNIDPRKLRFDARVGDELRITASNAQAGGCGLDAIWLHCRDGGRGKKLLGRTRSGPGRNDCDPDETGVFLKEVFRIRP